MLLLAVAAAPSGTSNDGITWTRAAPRGIFTGMSVSRGDFLKALGKSIPGMVLGSGAGVAVQKLLNKVAAASGAPGAPELPAATTQSARAPKAKSEFISSGPTEGNRIALTFDDGPTPGITDRILDELKQRNLHATFFMIGQRVAAAPDLARRVLAEGHEVGNHTYTHPNLTTLPAIQVESEIQKTQEVMGEIMNHRPVWFRPPYLAFRQNQAGLVTSRGMHVVTLSVDSRDWAQPGEEAIVRTVLKETKPGAIVVCHDMHEQTANCASQFLDGLIAKSFSFVTLSQLMG